MEICRESNEVLGFTKEENFLKMTTLWDIVSCNLVEVDRSFRGEYCVRQQDDESLIIAMMIEAIRTSETSAYFNETTRRYIP
jgi:hypothetical protein